MMDFKAWDTKESKLLDGKQFSSRGLWISPSGHIYSHNGETMQQSYRYLVIWFQIKNDIEIGESATLSEMPKYKCHKEVYALKIADIIYDYILANSENRETDGSATITPAVEGGHSPFKVDQEYLSKHNPQVGGYFVQYEDGYKSYSPAKAFEDGYTLIK